MTFRLYRPFWTSFDGSFGWVVVPVLPSRLIVMRKLTVAVDDANRKSEWASSSSPLSYKIWTWDQTQPFPRSSRNCPLSKKTHWTKWTSSFASVAMELSSTLPVSSRYDIDASSAKMRLTISLLVVDDTARADTWAVVTSDTDTLFFHFNVHSNQCRQSWPFILDHLASWRHLNSTITKNKSLMYLKVRLLLFFRFFHLKIVYKTFQLPHFRTCITYTSKSASVCH